MTQTQTLRTVLKELETIDPNEQLRRRFKATEGYHNRAHQYRMKDVAKHAERVETCTDKLHEDLAEIRNIRQKAESLWNQVSDLKSEEPAAHVHDLQQDAMSLLKQAAHQHHKAANHRTTAAHAAAQTDSAVALVSEEVAEGLNQGEYTLELAELFAQFKDRDSPIPMGDGAAFKVQDLIDETCSIRASMREEHQEALERQDYVNVLLSDCESMFGEVEEQFKQVQVAVRKIKGV